METGRCKHCRADEALHHGDTLQCPENGQASGDIGHNYWLNTAFEATMETQRDNNDQWFIDCTNNGIEKSPENYYSIIQANNLPIAYVRMGSIDGVPFSIEEGEKNLLLIQEAGNIRNETGLTPRQLLEQRDEMKSLIDKIMTNLTIALDHPHAAETCEEVAASLTDDIEKYIQKNN